MPVEIREEIHFFSPENKFKVDQNKWFSREKYFSYELQQSIDQVRVGIWRIFIRSTNVLTLTERMFDVFKGKMFLFRG